MLNSTLRLENKKNERIEITVTCKWLAYAIAKTFLIP